MLEIKTILSFLAIILAFVGYLPYFRDTIKGKTTPHIYTWFIWGLVTAIVFALQFSAGGGPGSWVSLAVVIISIIVFFLGLKNGKKDITKTDTLFFILSIVALLIWLVLKQPVISAVLVTIIDMLGFAPTIRKSWNKPYSETLFTYELGAFRHGLSFLALQHYNIITWLNPVSWIIGNTFFSIILIMRRRKLVR
jgi:hypothetical protein